MDWDSSDFDSLRDDMGRAGIRAITLWPNRPPIEVDLSGLETLILLGRIGDPVLTRSLATAEQKDGNGGEEEDETEEPPAPAEPAPSALSPAGARVKAIWEEARDTTKWQDDICAAVVVKPKWCRMEDVPRGARPPGQLCIFDLTHEQRRYMVNLCYQGALALETFRSDLDRSDSALHGGGLRDDASGPDPGTGPAAPLEVVAESGDLDAGQGRGVPPAAG